MKKTGKILLGTVLGVVGGAILIAGGYVGYVVLSYKRIPDNQKLEVIKNATNTSVTTNTTYKIGTYNIGFGAYSQDFTFFLDTGYDKDGNATCGHDSKGHSKEEVLENTKGSIKAIKDLNLDFAVLQEVDTNSTRSYHINQEELFSNELSSYDHTFAVNFASAYLPYPLYDMHGKANAGLVTYSKYSIQESVRKSYPISSSLSKLFDLDRCFSYNVINVNNGKKLYLVNSHMSAYDKGGTIREQQMKLLNEFLQERKTAGDYVVVGGDFNHDLLTYNPEYSYTSTSKPHGETKKDPDWVASFFNEQGKSPIIEGFSVVAADNKPTCRNNDEEYNPSTTYVCTVDGFIVSDNIQVVSKTVIETKPGCLGFDGFAFSDHQPVVMEFELK